MVFMMYFLSFRKIVVRFYATGTFQSQSNNNNSLDRDPVERFCLGCLALLKQGLFLRSQNAARIVRSVMPLPHGRPDSDASPAC